MQASLENLEFESDAKKSLPACSLHPNLCSVVEAALTNLRNYLGVGRISEW